MGTAARRARAQGAETQESGLPQRPRPSWPREGPVSEGVGHFPRPRDQEGPWVPLPEPGGLPAPGVCQRCLQPLPFSRRQGLASVPEACTLMVPPGPEGSPPQGGRGVGSISHAIWAEVGTDRKEVVVLAWVPGSRPCPLLRTGLWVRI